MSVIHGRSRRDLHILPRRLGRPICGVSQENSQLLKKMTKCNRHESQRFECAIIALSTDV